MNENTRKSLKIAAVTAIVLLALSAIVFVYANTHNGNNASDDQQQTNLQNLQPFISNITNMSPGQLKELQTLCNRPQFFKRLLQNATLSTIQGTVALEFKGMLLLDTSSGRTTVLLPKEWSVGSELIGRDDLFNSSFASSGSDVTVKVLKSDVFTNANFTLNIMVGYEAINATGTHAYAVLPFNIVPNS
jgi:hypothetical protein